MITIQELLKKTIELQATDLHLTADAPPLFRIDGVLKPIIPEKLPADLTQKLASSIMSKQKKELFDEKKEVSFSFGVQSLGRFRAHVFSQRGCTSCTLRHVPSTIKTIEELGLPKVVEKLISKANGLILITGPTGSGKTTTIAAIIDKINSEREGHILTVENPIEFMHIHRSCIVNQREVTLDTESYSSALTCALKQNPDVVFIGEMPDTETVQRTFSIAETGHLALTTMNTNSAVTSLQRIIDMFPPDNRSAICQQLSMVLEGVISQALIPLIGGGLVLACEILIVNQKVRFLISDNKIGELQSIIESEQEKGSQSLIKDLAQMYTSKKITKKDAISNSPDPEELLKQLS
jgi:twitching motility protein PilT